MKVKLWTQSVLIDTGYMTVDFELEVTDCYIWHVAQRYKNASFDLRGTDKYGRLELIMHIYLSPGDDVSLSCSSRIEIRGFSGARAGVSGGDIDVFGRLM